MTHALISSGLLFSCGGGAHAGAWSVSGRGELLGQYDDNARLSTAEPVAAWSSALDVSAQFLYQHDAISWRVNPHVRAVHYDAMDALNRTEQYLVTQLARVTERSSSSFSVHGTQDTTLTSEPGLTGLSEVNKRHRSLTASLDNTWKAGELTGVSSQLSAVTSRYLDAENTGLVDYDYGSVVFGGDHAWHEGSSLILQASAGRLQVPDIPRYDKTNLAVTLGYRHEFGPRWQMALSAGPSQVRANGRAESGSVYEFTLNRQSERSTLSLSLGRDLTPTGRGLLSRRELLNTHLRHELSERWSANLDLMAVRNRNLLPEGGLEQESVDYASASGGLGWRITPTWTLSWSVGYAQQQSGSDQPAARRRHTTLNISWNGLTHGLH